MICRFFNQPNASVIIEAPESKYPPTTAKQFIMDAVARNYGHMHDKISPETSAS